jgi:hypothetical protein
MTAEDPNRALAGRLLSERARQQLSRPALARRLVPQINEQCPSVPTLISYLKRWEHGDCGVSLRYQAPLAAALGLNPAELFGPAQTSPQPGTGTLIAALAALPGSADGEPGDWGDMDLARRQLLAALSLVLGAAAASAPLAGVLDLALASEPRDPADWHAAIADHLHALRTRPPGRARDDLVVDLIQLRHQLTRPGADRTELTRVLSALAIIHGALLTRLGEHTSALRWWRTAIHAADDSGDLSLRLTARGQAAGCGLYGQRDPAAVLALLDEADRIGAGQRRAWTADLTAARAKALSLLGRHAEAKAAVAVLFAVSPGGPGTAPIPSLWKPDQPHFAASWVYAAAGEETAADEARDRVLAYGFDYQYAANVRLHDALCMVAQGGTAEGVRRAAAVLDAMPAAYRSQMITETGRTVLRTIPPGEFGTPAVREFREILAATAPAVHALPS